MTDEIQSNIRILQHNCAKSTSTMISCLEYGLNNVDIILIQEPWIGPNLITISHPAYNCIMPCLNATDVHKPRVLTFVSKKFQYSVTPRPDISSDSDIQVLNISETNIENFMLLNVYNERNQKENSNEYTIERSLTKIELSRNSIVCGDFNAHHQWWNSKINRSIRANALIDWLSKFNCELVNKPDEYTFVRGNSKSIIDLTFITPSLNDKINRWSINEDACTGSDHEVIDFSINVSKIETVENPLCSKYNVQKANWDDFERFLKSNYEFNKIRMRQLINESNVDDLNQGAEFLRDIIINAADQFIPKKRICENSKVWWSNELTRLRKQMARSKRLFKSNYSNENFQIFKNHRNEYFHAIRSAKKDSWTKFLDNAIGKEVFQAYKFTKSNKVEKLPPIEYEGKINIEFEDKCNAFIDAMYPTPPEIDETDQSLNSNSNSNSNDEWPKLIESEIRNAIFTSSPNKAPGPDQLSFLIIQKAYGAIPDIFTMIYSQLINKGHHPICWRQGTGAILKKFDKSDYTVPKAYRIITLLNCLGKISEKIMATRLSYLDQISNLLDFDQMGGRKGKSAIDAVLNLIHDIELSLKSKKITSCVFLDVKGAFDHVSTKQLLNVMKRSNLSSQIINWVEEFMNNRSIELSFDGKKDRNRQIRTGIPQGSPISPMLFLIYIRFLFPKLRIDLNINSSSFIDDISISTSSKSIEKNCQVLTKSINVAFDWAKENAVKFDDDKSELIHFESKRIMSTNSITLPNGTILQPQKLVKWLGVFLDRKLTFKTHVEKRVASATRVIHSIHRLQNSEWGLSPMAGRQLYMTCTNAISDYGSEIWWKNQKQFANKMQKLQNLAVRKILGAFRTSPVAAMEIEANILPVNIRLDQKNQKLALRIMKMASNHSTKRRTPNNFPIENSDAETETENESKFADWNQEGLHATQLIRVLNSISNLIDDESIESISPPFNPWNEIDKLIELKMNNDSDKSLIRIDHFELLKSIFKRKNTAVFYTDGTYDTNTKIATSSCVLYQNSNVLTKAWNLGRGMNINDAELYAIHKSMKWAQSIDSKDIWIFTDSQNSIKTIQKNSHFLCEEIRQIAKTLQNQSVFSHIYWIPGHFDIPGNEKADSVAKSVISSSIITTDKFISFDYLKRQIIESNMNRWKLMWSQNKKKGKHYQIFNIKPGESKIKNLSNRIDKLTIATMMQLKLGHGFFKSYLVRLPTYDTKKCNGECNYTQDPEHLLIKCRWFQDEKSKLIKQMKPLPTTLQTLFGTNEGIKNLTEFLKITRVATRKWLLGNLEEEIQNDDFGWGNLQR